LFISILFGFFKIIVFTANFCSSFVCVVNGDFIFDLFLAGAMAALHPPLIHVRVRLCRPCRWLVRRVQGFTEVTEYTAEQVYLKSKFQSRNCSYRHIYTSGFRMRFLHCVAIFYYLPWLSKTKVGYKKIAMQCGR